MSASPPSPSSSSSSSSTGASSASAALRPTMASQHSVRIKEIHEAGPSPCMSRRKVRNLCENLRDQYVSTKAARWHMPLRGSHEYHLTHLKYRRGQRRMFGEIVYVCTESHTSTADHPFNPLIETQHVNHRKPKWAVDRSCTSTWFAVSLHVSVMVIVVASVITFIVDSLNYEYCMNLCPDFTRDESGTIVDCPLLDSEKASDSECNPVDNTGVPCDKVFSNSSVFYNPTSVNYYCSYHVAKGILDDTQIYYLDVVFTIVFTLELLVRGIVAESYCTKKKSVDKPSTPFFADMLNWCDFLAILPLPMQLIFREVGIDNSLRTEALSTQAGSAGAISSLAILVELFKMLRVIRVFKIARHFSGTRVMSKTVQKSMRPFRLTFIVLFLVFTVLGSTLMLIEPCYGAPGSDTCQFPDLFTAGYFLMITILTVGYGDQTPKTDVGRMVGILCMILGSCFLAMPLAIVGNKFQAAYEQEQAESQKASYNEGTDAEHITKAQRRQRMLNEGFILLGTIDHLQRVVDHSKEQRESAMSSLFKTHRVLAMDMAVLFPSLKPNLESLLKMFEGTDEDLDLDEEEDEYLENAGCCASCCRSGGARVVPLSKASSAGTPPAEDKKTTDLAVSTDRNGSGTGELKRLQSKGFLGLAIPKRKAKAETQPPEDKHDQRRTAALNSKKCRDKLWLFMEVHDSGKCAMAGYVIRHMMVILALLVSMLMMFHELNRWDENSLPCQRMAAGWCDLIHALDDDWTYEVDPNLDISGRFVGYNKSQLLAANPICGTMTCDNGLLCEPNPSYDWDVDEDDSNVITASTNSTRRELLDFQDGHLQYAGCTDKESCFANYTSNDSYIAGPVRCPIVVRDDTETTTRVVFSPVYQEITETTRTVEYDASREFIDYSTLSTPQMWDNTPVCERLVCKNNSDIQYAASLDQAMLNQLFFLSEVFFCCWFLGEFVLRVAAARDLLEFVKSFPNWLELACAVVATYELLILSIGADALSYEVWGMPLFASFPMDHVRPLRFIVPLRFLLMSRSYSGADVLLETARKAAPKLAIPVFFLIIMTVNFAGLYFALETQMDCHVEKVATNPYDPDAFVFQYVRDVAGTKCDLQDILDGMWLTIVTLTSVGYGRFYPRNISGQILSMLVAIVGAFYMAMPLAIVGTTFYSAYKMKEEARARIHVKRKFKNAVGMVRHFIRQGKINDKSLQTQSGLYSEEVTVLSQYMEMLGPPTTFTPDEATLKRIRRMHVITMNILGHMLASADSENAASKAMFG